MLKGITFVFVFPLFVVVDDDDDVLLFLVLHHWQIGLVFCSSCEYLNTQMFDIPLIHQ